MTYSDPTDFVGGSNGVHTDTSVGYANLQHVIVTDDAGNTYDYIIVEGNTGATEFYTIASDGSLTLEQSLQVGGSEQQTQDQFTVINDSDSNATYLFDTDSSGSNVVQWDPAAGCWISNSQPNTDFFSNGQVKLDVFQADDGTIYGYAGSTSTSGTDKIDQYIFNETTQEFELHKNYTPSGTLGKDFNSSWEEGFETGEMHVLMTNDGPKLMQWNAGGVDRVEGFTLYDIDPATGDLIDGSASSYNFATSGAISSFGTDAEIVVGNNNLDEVLAKQQTSEVTVDANGNIVILNGTWGTTEGYSTGMIVIDPSLSLPDSADATQDGDGDVDNSASVLAVHYELGSVSDNNGTVSGNAWGSNPEITYSPDGAYMYVTSSNTTGSLDSVNTHTIVVDTSDYSIVDWGADTTSGYYSTDATNNDATTYNKAPMSQIIVTTSTGEQFYLEQYNDSANATNGWLSVSEVTADVVTELTPNYIVEGTSENDLIDVNYTGDPESDKIDNDDGNPLTPNVGNDDSVLAFEGSDTIYSNVGNDTIDAGSGDDVVYAGTGNDSVLAGEGNDLIHGDGLTVPAGTDVNIVNQVLTHAATGLTTNNGAAIGYTFTVPGETLSLAIADDDGLLEDNNGSNAVEGSQSLDGSEQVLAGSFEGHPEGAYVHSRLYQEVENVTTGQTGYIYQLRIDNDYSGGFPGADGQYWAFTNDFIVSPGDEIRITGAGQSGGNVSFDALFSSGTTTGFDDSIEGGAGDDTIYGDAGNDTIRADEGDDSVLGGDGDDSIFGFEGSDTVSGGAGDDFINTRTSPGNGTPDQGLLYPDDPGTSADETALYSYPSDIAGTPNGSGGTFGGPDDDRDSVDGGTGNDTILTGDDDDTILGGEGADVIDAGFDDDTVHGGAGADSIQGSEGNDTIDGGDDDDVIYGGVSPLDPNYGVAQLYDLEDAGVNTQVDPNASNNNDLLSGGAGNDSLYGQDDSDTLSGGTGNDFLDGGIDDDSLDGGDGSDSLIGGQGDDVFLVSSGNDTIGDFGAGQTGPIDDGDQTNNDFVDLSSQYNWTTYNAAVAAGDIDPSVIKNPLQWARADLADDGVLDDTAAGWSATDTLQLDLSGATIDPTTMTFDTINVVCFSRGTLIKTQNGEIKVEDLEEGVPVLTLDSGYQPVRWIGSRVFEASDLQQHANLRPIRIAPGALGHGMPEEELLVSPQHRVLVNAPVVERMFNQSEVLVAAKQLLSLDGIDVAEDVEAVEYWHFLLDDHQVVFSNGARTETMFTGPEALKTVSEEAREEIFTIFPQLEEQGDGCFYKPARHLASGRRGRQLAARLAKNHKPPVA